MSHDDFADEFDAAALDAEVWVPHYLPQWSSRAESAATYAVAGYWEELSIHADDFRAIPGSVIVMGHVDGRRDGEPVRRSAIWTWKVSDGKATHVRVADMGSPS